MYAHVFKSVCHDYFNFVYPVNRLNIVSCRKLFPHEKKIAKKNFFFTTMLHLGQTIAADGQNSAIAVHKG